MKVKITFERQVGVLKKLYSGTFNLTAALSSDAFQRSQEVRSQVASQFINEPLYKVSKARPPADQVQH
jgi:hypothetical protein